MGIAEFIIGPAEGQTRRFQPSGAPQENCDPMNAYLLPAAGYSISPTASAPQKQQEIRTVSALVKPRFPRIRAGDCRFFDLDGRYQPTRTIRGGITKWLREMASPSFAPIMVKNPGSRVPEPHGTEWLSRRESSRRAF